MARSRRRAPRRSFRRRKRADWVYRSDLIASEDLTSTDGLGTYAPGSVAITAGWTGQLGLVLYDTVNFLGYVAHQDVAAHNSMVRRASRAEGRKPTYLGCQGQLIVIPSQWAVGQFYRLAYRIIIAEQDLDYGTPLLNAGYSLWSGVVTDYQPADFANMGRQNIYEHRMSHRYTDASSTPERVLNFNVKTRRRLEPHEGVFLLLETIQSSVTIAVQPWLRSLVIDEG